MAQQGGDGFEGHAPVDALGRQGVAQGVRVHVADPGASACGDDVAVDGAPVEGLVVVSFDEQPGGGGTAPGPVVVDETDEHRVEGDGSVVVELPEGDAQPVGVAELVHGVVCQGGQLSGAHARAGQEFDHEPASPVGVGGRARP